MRKTLDHRIERCQSSFRNVQLVTHVALRVVSSLKHPWHRSPCQGCFSFKKGI